MAKVKLNRHWTDYNKVQLLIGALIRNRSFQLKDLSELKKKYLNIGCGWNPNPNFVNLDYSWTRDIDICWDITKGKLPFSENCFDGIYTEHCLEHISFHSCNAVLKETYRILKPNEVLRIIVPDGELYFEAYQKIKNGEDIKMPYYDDSISPMQRINRIFREHGHQFIYDFETFKIILEGIGFNNIRKLTFCNGQNTDLLIDSANRKIESLYLECQK